MTMSRKKYDKIEKFSNLIIKRLKIAYNVHTDSDLCKILNIKTSTLNSWKIKNYIDLQWLFHICKNLNFNWLLYEKGDFFIKEEYDNKYNEKNIIKEKEISYNQIKQSTQEIVIRIKIEAPEEYSFKISENKLPINNFDKLKL